MSHPEQIEFVERVRKLFPHLFSSTRVIEIGSLDINGSIRTLFDGCEYVGVDLEPGIGVDLVSLGHEVDLDDRSFEVAISCECFEHNPHWRETFLNMCRMTRELVVLTVATHGRPEHGTTSTTPEDSPFTQGRWDYYRNLGVEDLSLFPLNQLFKEYEISYSRDTNDIYFWGLLAEAETPVTRSRRKAPRSIPKDTRETVDDARIEMPGLRSDPNWAHVLADFVEPIWYLHKNPDVAAAGMDPLTHFREHGISENRSPNRFFDPAFYLEVSPDVVAADRPAFAHFLEYGRFEGRKCHHLVDVEWCTKQAIKSGATDYFVWLMSACLKGGGFPANPARAFFLPAPLSSSHEIHAYNQYLDQLRGEIDAT